MPPLQGISYSIAVNQITGMVPKKLDFQIFATSAKTNPIDSKTSRGRVEIIGSYSQSTDLER